MADGKKLIEDLKQKVAELRKNVEDKKTSSENLEKQVKDLVAAQMAARKEEVASELRKGVYNPMREEEVKPHSKIVEKSDDPKVQDFQRWNDDVYILSKILKADPRTLKTWDKFAPKFSDLRKAMDTAESGGGSDWIPTNFSAELIRRLDLELKVAALFRRINMPSDPFKIPALRAHSTAYKISEQTADGVMTGASAYTASQPTTANVTFDAVKLGVSSEFSVELQEDSIIPVLDMLKEDIAFTMAQGIEDAIINGDTAGTHQDTDVTAAGDVRKAWNGLRKIGTTTTDLSTFNLAGMRTVRRKMGKYGVNPSQLVWIVSAKGYVLMQGLDEVITLEKYGPNATVLNGELGRLDGIPIVVSEKVRDDLNASGVNDSTTNTKGIIILVHTPSFALGQRRALTMHSFFDPRRDQTGLYLNWRGDFQALQPTTDVIESEAVNLGV